MLERFRRSPWMELFRSLAGVLVGLILATVFQEKVIEFMISTRAFFVGSLVLALLMFITIVTVGVFAQRSERDRSTLARELEDIKRKVGLTVAFIYDPPRESTGEIYRKATEIIEGAKKEIWVLSYLRPRRAGEEEQRQSLRSEAYKKERDRYTGALLNKLQEHKDDTYFYRRIIQLPEGPVEGKITSERERAWMFKHLQELFEFLHQHPDAAYLKKAPAFFEQTFLLVDERYVLWTFDAIDPDTKRARMDGALLFEDPHKEFIPYLKNFFRKVDAHATIVRQVPES